MLDGSPFWATELTALDTATHDTATLYTGSTHGDEKKEDVRTRASGSQYDTLIISTLEI